MNIDCLKRHCALSCDKFTENAFNGVVCISKKKNKNIRKIEISCVFELKKIAKENIPFFYLTLYPFLINNIFRCGIIFFPEKTKNNLLTISFYFGFSFVRHAIRFDFWDTFLSINVHFFSNHQ